MTKASRSAQSVLTFGSDQHDLPPARRRDAGEKGQALVELSRAGAPVPPGFILPAGLCPQSPPPNGELPAATREALRSGLDQLGERSGRVFGDARQPLLVALRGSLPAPMPRAQDAVLNVGLTEAGVKTLSKGAGDARAAWDAYRRLIQTFGVHVKGVCPDAFDTLVTDTLEQEGVEADFELGPEAMQGLALALRGRYEEETGEGWPDDPMGQLTAAMAGAYAAWHHPDAVDHRLECNLDDLPGAALVVQAMVWGTGGKQSGAGRLVTRVAASGEKKHGGQYLDTAQGPDLTAGIRMTDPVTRLEERHAPQWEALQGWADALERHFRDALDLQFTLDNGTLWLLQARPAQRTARASLHIALDLEGEGICDERRALSLITPSVVEEYLHPVLDKSGADRPLTRGLPASPGSAVGQVVFFAEHAVELAAQGIKTILVRHETTPEDIDGLKVAEGIITVHGGLTSHAAVVARGMGKCCVVGASSLSINYLINEMTVDGTTVQRMDWLSIDGNTGEVYAGQLPQVQPSLEGGMARALEWADKHRRLGVYANADNAEDARRAVELGAWGIGLCRTEHMFFEIDRIPVFRRMILAVNEEGRAAALGDLLPLQRRDFMEIFRVMADKPVTIRLLDPPLHEFLPRGIRSQTRMARTMNIPVEAVQQRAEALSEANPMMGHRGCRLAVTYPEIYNMQVRAIVEAACIVSKEGVHVEPEIMVPLVTTARELKMLRRDIDHLVAQVLDEMDEQVPIRVGTMLETPRAAVTSRAIAPHADFYSFGTNDLTQMGYGFSRDDIGMFLPMYLEKHILDIDPFIQLDQEGIGKLVEVASTEGRAVNPDLKLGICGEHGGEPHSVKFFHRLGLDYVSCSPFRIPVARLAAGQAAVEPQDR